MPYFGTFAKNRPIFFEVATALRTAVTFHWFKPGRIVDIQVLNFDASNGSAFELSSPAQAERLVVEVSAMTNSNAVVKVSQGIILVDVAAVPDAVIQLDLV